MCTSQKTFNLLLGCKATNPLPGRWQTTSIHALLPARSRGQMATGKVVGYS